MRTIVLWGGGRFNPQFLHVQLQITADGSAEVHGTIHLPDTDPPHVLVAVPGSAHAACADRDGDGVAGLTRVTAQFRPPSGGNGVAFILDAGGVDIAASGVYPVVLQIGETTITTEVKVRFAPDPVKARDSAARRARHKHAGAHHGKRHR